MLNGKKDDTLINHSYTASLPVASTEALPMTSFSPCFLQRASKLPHTFSTFTSSETPKNLLLSLSLFLCFFFSLSLDSVVWRNSHKISYIISTPTILCNTVYAQWFIYSFTKCPHCLASLTLWPQTRCTYVTTCNITPGQTQKPNKHFSFSNSSPFSSPSSTLHHPHPLFRRRPCPLLLHFSPLWLLIKANI